MEEFIPRRLTEARKRIVEELPLKSKASPARPVFSDAEKRRFLTEIAALPKRLVLQRAYALPYERIEIIADYLAGNIYHLKLDNLFSIFHEREDKDLYSRMMIGWDSYYANAECNKFLSDQVKTSLALQLYIAEIHMNPDEFGQMLSAGNIPEWWGEYLEKHPAPDVNPWNISESMEYYGIIRNSRLYDQIQLRYYLVCDRRAFESKDLTPLRLKSNIEQYAYNKEDIRKFMIHFLECFGGTGKDNSKPWQVRFYPIASTFERIIGANGTQTQDAFFETIDSRLKTAYQQWLNRATIENTFGSTDERTRFWKRFEFGSVTFYRSAGVLVMQTCDNEHYVIEFQGKAQGPLYILDKETFLGMQPNVCYYSNPELRKYLYSKYSSEGYTRSPHIHRQEHKGDWRYQVDNYMILHHLADHSMISY